MALAIDDLKARFDRFERGHEHAQRERDRVSRELAERISRLEKWVEARGSSGRPISMLGGPASSSSGMSERLAGDVDLTLATSLRERAPAARSASPNEDPERVGFELLDLIDPAGRRAPLARLAELTDWLAKSYPSVRAEPVSPLNRDLWRLVVLTADGRTGVVVPALDSPVGPGEALKWFEGGRYDGTQALVRMNVWSLATAARDEETQTWRPAAKGKIDLA